jgi:serine/threonine protein phosphatase 1
MGRGWIVSRFQSFELNTRGHDYLTFDPHACWTEVEMLLKKVKFNESRDRLFIGGDLADRGPDPLRMLHYLSKDWCHVAMGNHCFMLMCAGNGYYDGEYDVDLNALIDNGGEWFLNLPLTVQSEIATLLAQLPLAMEIATPYGTVGVVHAEPYPTWAQTKQLTQGYHTLSPEEAFAVIEQLLWSRKRLKAAFPKKEKGVAPVIAPPIPDIWRVYVGHSADWGIRKVSNVWYMDTALCFGGKATLIDLTRNRVHHQTALRTYWIKPKRPKPSLP